jgi:hypothetical protein
MTLLLSLELSEAVAGFELTAVDGGLLCFQTSPDVAGSPAQGRVWAQRKYHGRAVDVGLEAHSFLGWRQGEVESLTEDDGIQFAHLGTNGRVIDLSLH